MTSAIERAIQAVGPERFLASPVHPGAAGARLPVAALGQALAAAAG